MWPTGLLQYSVVRWSRAGALRRLLNLVRRESTIFSFSNRLFPSFLLRRMNPTMNKPHNAPTKSLHVQCTTVLRVQKHPCRNRHSNSITSTYKPCLARSHRNSDQALPISFPCSCQSRQIELRWTAYPLFFSSHLFCHHHQLTNCVTKLRKFAHLLTSSSFLVSSIFKVLSICFN